MIALPLGLGSALWNGPLLLLFGMLEIAWGALAMVAGVRWPAFGGDRSLRNKLAVWRVSPEEAGTDLGRQIHAYYRSLSAVMLVVTGFVVTLAGAALVMLADAGHPLPVWYAAGVTIVFYGYPANVVGTSLGYSLAVRLARRSDDAGPRYADMRRRRLADYRAPVLRWLAVAAVALQTAVGIAFGVFLSTWSVLVISAVMALTVAVVELQMSAAARVPRMVVTADPVVARRCDDLVRSGVIARLQQLMLVSLMFACFLQMWVLGLARTPDGPLRYAGALTQLSGYYLAFLGLGLAGLDERLGGRITGWGGRPMPE
jgi:hypothetical protein